MPLDFRPRWRYVVNKAGAANAAPALKYKFYFTPHFCGYTEFGIVPLDGFIDLVRVEQQRSRTQGEKLQPSRPSVRDKLKQELPAHKPAAPKKREPER